MNLADVTFWALVLVAYVAMIAWLGLGGHEQFTLVTLLIVIGVFALRAWKGRPVPNGR